jgi:hypothetical protein
MVAKLILLFNQYLATCPSSLLSSCYNPEHLLVFLYSSMFINRLTNITRK